MKRKTFENAPCSIARSLDVLGDWWAPLIIRECLYGIHRFDDFQHWLGIGRNMLTRRLNKLIEQGILERRPYQTRPTRHEYHLTERGYDAARVLIAMMPFGEQWFFEDAQAPIALYDRRTNAPIVPRLVDAHTGEPIDVRWLYAGPGPGFPEVGEAVLRERFREYYARQQTRDEGD